MEFKPNGSTGLTVAPAKPEEFTLEGKPVFTPGQSPQVLEVIDPRRGPVNQWAITALMEFEDCPHKTFLKRVKRIPDKGNVHTNRGSAIHAEGEDYVMGKEPYDPAIHEIDEKNPRAKTEVDQDGVPVSFKKFRSSLMRLKEDYANGMVEVEGDWAFDLEWQPTEWKSPQTWSRHKLDVFVREDITSGLVIDYKTGKKYGNEMKHGQQALDYAIAAFMRYAELEFVRVEFWYLDTGETLIKTYTRAQAMALLPGLEKRAVKMTSCLDFPPKPNRNKCKYCNYKDNGCDWSAE